MKYSLETLLGAWVVNVYGCDGFIFSKNILHVSRNIYFCLYLQAFSQTQKTTNSYFFLVIFVYVIFIWKWYFSRLIIKYPSD